MSSTKKQVPWAFITMGVSGSGKTTVGEALANFLKVPYKDADDFHPPENKDKMKKGIPLTDEDRVPWLQALKDEIYKAILHQSIVVLSCSALKKRYRDFLRKGCSIDQVVFIYMKVVDRDAIRERMRVRQIQTGHYMPPSLLDSQLAALEEPTSEEPVITYSCSLTTPQVLSELKQIYFNNNSQAKL